MRPNCRSSTAFTFVKLEVEKGKAYQNNPHKNKYENGTGNLRYIDGEVNFHFYCLCFFTLYQTSVKEKNNNQKIRWSNECFRLASASSGWLRFSMETAAHCFWLLMHSFLIYSRLFLSRPSSEANGFLLVADVTSLEMYGQDAVSVFRDFNDYNMTTHFWLFIRWHTTSFKLSLMPIEMVKLAVSVMKTANTHWSKW